MAGRVAGKIKLQLVDELLGVHQITCLKDFMELYENPYQRLTVERLVKLPHPTIQKFGIINVVIVGASRRFLAQITRHQNEVKYMSASLQYSDYSGVDDFVIPYDLLDTKQEADYLEQCKRSMENYQEIIKSGVDNDSAGYCAPQGMRNILLISATPYQWKHMIHQRVCRRNTKETRYVMLKIWEQLLEQNRELFIDSGPFCMNGGCEEGNMTCGKCIPSGMSPTDIIRVDFPKLEDKYGLKEGVADEDTID